MSNEVIKGLPDIKPRNSTNGQYALGKAAALKVSKAGPGHHSVTSFDSGSDAEVSSFTAGARATADGVVAGLVVSRRKMPLGSINVYVIHNPS
jgi:hypothetical protein